MRIEQHKWDQFAKSCGDGFKPSQWLTSHVPGDHQRPVVGVIGDQSSDITIQVRRVYLSLSFFVLTSAFQNNPTSTRNFCPVLPLKNKLDTASCFLYALLKAEWRIRNPRKPRYWKNTTFDPFKAQKVQSMGALRHRSTAFIKPLDRYDYFVRGVEYPTVRARQHGCYTSLLCNNLLLPSPWNRR